MDKDEHCRLLRNPPGDNQDGMDVIVVAATPNTRTHEILEDATPLIYHDSSYGALNHHPLTAELAHADLVVCMARSDLHHGVFI